MLVVYFVTPQLAQSWNFPVAGNTVVSPYAEEIMGQWTH